MLQVSAAGHHAQLVCCASDVQRQGLSDQALLTRIRAEHAETRNA